MSAPHAYQQGGYPAAGNPYHQGGNPYEPSGPYNSGGYPAFQQQGSGVNPYPQHFNAPGYGHRPAQPGAYGPSPGYFMPNDQRTQRLNQVVQQYEINQQFTVRLQALGNCEVVVLCDDSGSMNTPLQGTNQTRWDELKSVCVQKRLCFLLILLFVI